MRPLPQSSKSSTLVLPSPFDPKRLFEFASFYEIIYETLISGEPRCHNFDGIFFSPPFSLKAVADALRIGHCVPLAQKALKKYKERFTALLPEQRRELTSLDGPQFPAAALALSAAFMKEPTFPVSFVILGVSIICLHF